MSENKSDISYWQSKPESSHQFYCRYPQLPIGWTAVCKQNLTEIFPLKSPGKVFSEKSGMLWML